MSTAANPREARIQQLREASARKSADATAKAKRAIIALESKGRPINFRTVATAAGVSKDFLYATPDLRRTIIDKRRPVRALVNLPAATTRSGSDQVKLQVATDALRRMRAENATLRAENARLRGDNQALRRRLTAN